MKIKKTDQLSETEICTNSLCFMNLFSFQNKKRIKDFDFFALILLEHVKVSSSITKMKLMKNKNISLKCDIYIYVYIYFLYN